MAYIRSQKHRVTRQVASSSVVAAIGLAACSSVLAQQVAPDARNARTLAEVEVSGDAQTYKTEQAASPKMTANLVDTPQTVTVINREVIEEQNASTLQEALRNTPGVTLLLGEGGNSNTKDNIFMRGFDTSSSIFVDGVRDLGSQSRDTFNVEQIDVIKGASGSEYGRGAPSGTINMATKVPFTGNANEARVSMGTDDHKRITADINRSLSDTSAVRLNAMAQNSGTPGRDFVRNKGFGFAPSVGFGLGTPTRVFADLSYVKKNNRPDGGVPTLGLPGFYNAALANAGVDLSGLAAVDSSNYYGSLSDYSKTESTQATLRVEHDFSADATLRNTTRIGQNEFDQLLTGTSAVVSDGSGANAVARLDPATWTASRSRQLRWQKNSIATNQTNLSARFALAGMQHTLNTGVELIYEKQTTKGLTGAGTVAQANLYNPNVNDPIAGQDIQRTGQRSNGNTKTLALYAFDTVELHPQWQATGGVRVERYRTQNDSVTAPDAAGVQTFSNLKASDTLVSGKLGLVFKPTANGSIYGGISTSQQPPGGSNFTLSATESSINNPNMDPSKSTNVELGTKWNLWDNRLMVTGAVFRTTVKNDLTRTVEGDIQQYGKKQVSGVELGVVGQLTPAWNVTAGLARMNTKVKDGSSTQTGAQLNWSPKLSFTSWTSYRLGNGLTVGGGARYMDSVTRSVSNSADPAMSNMLNTPSYWVYDAYLAYEINRNVSLQLNVFNLADKKYIANLNNNGGRYTPGAARSAQVTANIKF
ncbi:catecholate siderophore receptor Fiu [Lampropedia puyangensis]|uniref:Catecholate siderophore receptor Fiu n=1 Tax=Lampropedia puyangensis TaxID=1330072 RepID=A0A4S8FDU5_9BURK|nr:catecholate siderophore receptor Fiu [Lampropedia puyangensis]THU05467.1 catecholate siderophore receptor Fiu [Lampropedia puyangensis]